jgi:hypothetical protein
MGIPDIAVARSSSFTFAPQNLKNWNSARERRAPDWPGVPAFAPAGGWVAGGETARETENLATWGGESGRGRRAGGEIPGVGGGGAAEFQVFSFSESGHSDFRIRGLLCAQLGL